MKERRMAEVKRAETGRRGGGGEERRKMEEMREAEEEEGNEEESNNAKLGKADRMNRGKV